MHYSWVSSRVFTRYDLCGPILSLDIPLSKCKFCTLVHFGVFNFESELIILVFTLNIGVPPKLDDPPET